MPADDPTLRLALAAERLAVLTGTLEGRMSTVEGTGDGVGKDLAAHRLQVEPVVQAHGAYLARLAAAENEAAADAVAATKNATERAAEAEAKAREAAAKEQEQRDKARTAAWTLALQVAIPLLTGALGIGGTWYALAPGTSTSAPAISTTPTPAQDAPGVAP